MTSFGYRLNPHYVIKECLSCGALYTGDFCCSKGNVEDKILVPKLPKNCARCAKCGHPVNGPYCQRCTLLREKLEEDLVTYFQNFQNTFESSEDSTNVVNAPREPFAVKMDHGVNPPHIDECCCECGDALDGIFCQQCTWDLMKPSSVNQRMKNITISKILAIILILLKKEEKRIEEKQAASAKYWKISACCDDDDDYNSAITPVLSTEEPVDSLSMGDEHLDTIPATESDKVIKSSVEDLVSILSEFEGIPNTMCDVHLVNNPTPLEAKDHFEIVINSKDDISSSDDDSLYNKNNEYVEASPHDFKVVSLEVAEIVILEVEEIEDDNLREKLLNSSSTSLKSFLEDTNTFYNSLPEFENFFFDLEEISSGSTTTYSDISLSEYDSFVFDPSNDQFPPTDRSDLTHEEFANKLAHIISPSEYDCFYFRNFLDSGELISQLRNP
nr:hypothetical protein [Tanacetum cinerariifolium]